MAAKSIINLKICYNYTKTGLVFGFSKNQSLVAVILGQNSFWILSENYFEMSIKCRLDKIQHLPAQAGDAHFGGNG